MAKHKDPTKKQINEAAKATGAFLGAMIDTHQGWLEEAIQALEIRIVDRLASLRRRTDDRLYAAKVNLKQAQKIHKELRQIFNEIYGRTVRVVVRDYNRIARHIQDSWEEFDYSVTWTAVDKDLITVLKRRTYDGFLRFGVDAQSAMSRAMYHHIAGGAPFSDLTETARSLLTGKVSRTGRPMTTYAEQFAFDASMNFHNAVNLKKAADLGFTHFRYVGDVIDNTRDWCARHVWNVYAKATIESWVPTWTGASGPALTHRGGYNCRHHWQAVNPAWFSKGK